MHVTVEESHKSRIYSNRPMVWAQGQGLTSNDHCL